MPQDLTSRKLDPEQLRILTEKMDKMIRLLALIALRGEDTEKGKIAILDSLGFTAIEISKALNKPPNYVGAVLGQIRKASRPKEATKVEESKPQDQAPMSQTESTY